MALFAAVQMVSGPEVAPNLEAAGRLVAAAAAAGARVVALPENFALLGLHESDKLKAREADGAGPIQEFLAHAARAHRVWLIGGTMPMVCGDPARARAACLVHDDSGRRVARYDKRHMFRLTHAAESHDEARTIEPGTELVTLDTPHGRFGLSVCYDVRFPELYRSAGAAVKPVDAWFVPSAFTALTGAAHWETLLRARAIENQCYVIAPAQGGRHPGGRRTHGHTLIVDPWGEVLAVRAEGEGVVLASVDSDRLAEVRKSLPALEHRAIF